MVPQQEAPHLASKPMNEDIDFYNKASRSGGSSDEDDDDDEDESVGQVATAGPVKKDSVDPDLVGDSG